MLFEERCEMIRDMWEKEQSAVPFCATCLIKKPPRSKHCSVCDRCIKRYILHLIFGKISLGMPQIFIEIECCCHTQLALFNSAEKR